MTRLPIAWQLYSILAVRVQPHDQVKVNALVQMAGQMGRGVGPMLATWFYDVFVSR